MIVAPNRLNHFQPIDDEDFFLRAEVVHLVSDGIQNSVIRLIQTDPEHAYELGELKSWPYPEHAGSRRLKSWLEIVNIGPNT